MDIKKNCIFNLLLHFEYFNLIFLKVIFRMIIFSTI